MTEHKEGHRKSAAHSARHLARVFVMLGLYQWLADPSQDYAGIEAHLSSLLHDEEEQLEGSDIRRTSRRPIASSSRSCSPACLTVMPKWRTPSPVTPTANSPAFRSSNVRCS